MPIEKEILKSIKNNNILEVILGIGEQSSSLLEDILEDNKDLKNELKIIIELKNKVCFLEKQLKEIKDSEKNCQDKLDEKLNSIYSKVNKNKETLTDKNSDLKDYINDKLGGFKDYVNIELTNIKIVAAKEGAKYGVICSIIGSVLSLVLSAVLHKFF